MENKNKMEKKEVSVKSIGKNMTPNSGGATPISFIEKEVIASVERGETIITRYPPEPNGYAHIGHAKAFGISNAMARKYGGYTNLRFDDTNPAKEDMEYVNAMIRDIDWLGLEYIQVLFASDYYDALYEMAVGLIKKGLAYVDHQTAEEISANRGSLTTAGINSPFRDRSIAENLELFAKMRAGEFPDGACVLRAKIDMASGNINMRDPAMYRIARETHYRTGDAWIIYPMYSYAHPLSDAIEGISQSLCSLEFEDQRVLYDWFIEHAFKDAQFDGINFPNLARNILETREKIIKAVTKNNGTSLSPAEALRFRPLPEQREFSRLNIEQTVMSKRYLKKFVDTGFVDGWDDPRMPTISGMRRRGYPANAIRDFAWSTGISKSPMTVPLSALEFYVREALDPIAMRVSVVTNPIKVKIINWTSVTLDSIGGGHVANGLDRLTIANHNKDESLGSHEITFSDAVYIGGDDFSENPPPKYKRLTVGGYVRLRGGYIIKCENVIKNPDGTIDHLEAIVVENSRSGSDTSGVKPAGVIHYVDSTNAVEISVREYSPILIEGTSLDEGNINNNSVIVHSALAEPWIMENLTKEIPVQFVRKGFYVYDEKLSSGDEIVFGLTVSLKG